MPASETRSDIKRYLARYAKQGDGPIQASVDRGVAALVAAAAARNPDMAALSREVDAHNVKVASLAANSGMFKLLTYAFRVGNLASERARIITKMAAVAGVEIDAQIIKMTALKDVNNGLPLPHPVPAPQTGE